MLTAMGLNPADHICVLCKTDEEQLSVMARFVADGLRQNHKIIYVEENPAKAKALVATIRATGEFEMEGIIASGQLSIQTASESYLKAKFAGMDMVTFFGIAEKKALEEGYANLRITAEPTWVLDIEKQVTKRHLAEASVSIRNRLASDEDHVDKMESEAMAQKEDAAEKVSQVNDTMQYEETNSTSALITHDIDKETDTGTGTGTEMAKLTNLFAADVNITDQKCKGYDLVDATLLPSVASLDNAEDLLGNSSARHLHRQDHLSSSRTLAATASPSNNKTKNKSKLSLDHQNELLPDLNPSNQESSASSKDGNDSPISKKIPRLCPHHGHHHQNIFDTWVQDSSGKKGPTCETASTIADAEDMTTFELNQKQNNKVTNHEKLLPNPVKAHPPKQQNIFESATEMVIKSVYNEITDDIKAKKRIHHHHNYHQNEHANSSCIQYTSYATDNNHNANDGGHCVDLINDNSHLYSTDSTVYSSSSGSLRCFCAKLHEFIVHEKQMTSFYRETGSKLIAMCVFNTSRWNPRFCLHVLTTHPLVLVDGFLYKNMYYCPVEDWTDSDSNLLILQRWYSNLSEKRRSEMDAAENNQKAIEVLNIKNQLLTHVNHEIRTPLSSIIGMVSILSETSLTAEQKSCVSVIQSCSSHLLSIANDVLDIARLESNKMTVEYSVVDLQTLVFDSVTLGSAARLADSERSNSLQFFQPGLIYDVKIDDDVPKRIITDEVRLRQVLVNLISNAKKFSFRKQNRPDSPGFESSGKSQSPIQHLHSSSASLSSLTSSSSLSSSTSSSFASSSSASSASSSSASSSSASSSSASSSSASSSSASSSSSSSAKATSHFSSSSSSSSSSSVSVVANANASLDTEVSSSPSSFQYETTQPASQIRIRIRVDSSFTSADASKPSTLENGNLKRSTFYNGNNSSKSQTAETRDDQQTMSAIESLQRELILTPAGSQELDSISATDLIGSIVANSTRDDSSSSAATNMTMSATQNSFPQSSCMRSEPAHSALAVLSPLSTSASSYFSQKGDTSQMQSSHLPSPPQSISSRSSSEANSFSTNCIFQQEDRNDNTSSNDLLLEFIVADDGIGISKDRIPLIFEGFNPASSETNRTYGGSGLGLSICKKIVTLLNGKISVESIVNKGSTFRFTLPVRKWNDSNDPAMQLPITLSHDSIKASTPDVSKISAGVSPMDSTVVAPAILGNSPEKHKLESSNSLQSHLPSLTEIPSTQNSSIKTAGSSVSSFERSPPFLSSTTRSQSANLVPLSSPSFSYPFQSSVSTSSSSPSFAPSIPSSTSLAPTSSSRHLPGLIVYDEMQTRNLQHVPSPLLPVRPKSDNQHAALDASSLHVLIADDDPICLGIMTRSLSTFNCKITVAKDGMKAIEMALANASSPSPVDILITDLSLPKVGGWDVAKYVKEILRDNPPSLYLHTADSSTKYDQRTSFIEGIIIKPASKNVYRAILEEKIKKLQTENF